MTYIKKHSTNLKLTHFFWLNNTDHYIANMFVVKQLSEVLHLQPCDSFLSVKIYSLFDWKA